MKAKAIKSKSRRKSRGIPPSVSLSDVEAAFEVINAEPSVFWEHVEGLWDWSELRQRGQLSEQVRALDHYFVTRSKTHKVCPIVLLLNNGPNE